MRPPPLLVLLGPHGAGKSTLGRRVSRALGWRFDEEVGDRMRRAALVRDPGAHAFAAQPDFDVRVFEAELARDHDRREPCVVETWHPGNLAYARCRSPELAKDSEGCLREASLRAGALIQPVVIGRAAAIARCREPGPATRVDAFLAVGADAVAIAVTWGLCVLPEIRTDEVDEKVAVQQILATVGAFGPTAWRGSVFDETPSTRARVLLSPSE